MMIDSKKLKMLPSLISPPKKENSNFNPSNFVRNTKNAKSIMLAHKSKKQIMVHQSHLRQVLKRKYLESLQSQKKLRKKEQSCSLFSEEIPSSKRQISLEIRISPTEKNVKDKIHKHLFPIINRSVQVNLSEEKYRKFFNGDKNNKLHLHPKTKQVKAFSKKQLIKTEDRYPFEGSVHQKRTEIRKNSFQRERFLTQETKRLEQITINGWNNIIKGEEILENFNIQ